MDCSFKLLLCTTIVIFAPLNANNFKNQEEKQQQQQFLQKYVHFTQDIQNVQDVQYDHTKSLDFLYYSKASYCYDYSIQDWDCPACQHNNDLKDITVVQNDEHKLLGYLGYNQEQNYIVVAFRGTHYQVNYDDEKDIRLTEYPYCQDCKVAKGFFYQWNLLKYGIMDAYEILLKKYPDSQTIVTGHSLGGALSLLASYELRRNNYTVDYLYTFGTPRVGNVKLAEFGHSQLPYAIQVVHTKDPAPHEPYQQLGYRQLPTQVWYYSETDDQTYKICNMPGVEEDPNCSNSVDRKEYDFDDHLWYLGVYIGCTDKQKNQTLSYFN